MIRYLEDREKLNIMSLYEQCFDDAEEYKSYFFEDILPNNHIAVYEESGEIKGMLQLIPKAVNVGKNKSHCFYIYGVATDKNCRQKGIMKEIFENVLKDLYDNQECFTYLVPSNKENGMIYKGLGFEYVMDKKLLKKEDLRKKPTHSLILRKADYSDLSRLSIFAQSYMESHYGVFLSKDKEYFKNMFSLMDAEGGKVELYFENKIVLGYRIGFEDEVIEEVLDTNIQAMSWEGADTKEYAMARLLNIPKALKLMGTSSAGEVVVKLSDDVIDENNGVFLLQYDGRRITWEPTKQKSDVEVTIGELSAHVFGYKVIEGLPKINMKAGFYINDYV